MKTIILNYYFDDYYCNKNINIFRYDNFDKNEYYHDYSNLSHINTLIFRYNIIYDLDINISLESALCCLYTKINELYIIKNKVFTNLKQIKIEKLKKFINTNPQFRNYDEWFKIVNDICKQCDINLIIT